MSNINSYSYYGEMELDNMITDFEENIKLTETRDLIDLMDYLKMLLDKEKNETDNKTKEDSIEQNQESISNEIIDSKLYTKEEVIAKIKILKRYSDKNNNVYISHPNKPGYVNIINLDTASDEQIMKSNIVTAFF
jgi:hypothetical protein